MPPVDDAQRESHKSAIILANDDAMTRKALERILTGAFPATEIIIVETIADIYGAISQIANQRKHLAAIVSDEKFDTDTGDVHSSISASHELPHIREKLEEALGTAGSTTPIILHSGGVFYTSPPDHAYFLDVEVWVDVEGNETNPLYRILAIATGLSSEALDKTTIRQSTESRFWGEKSPGRDKSR